MNKFKFTALVVLLLVPLAGLQAAGPSRPNVIVMIADDLGYGDVSCLSHGAVQTPNIDRLAGMGVTFTAGYVTAPLCAPSRAGFYTGQYQQRFGFVNNQGGIPAGVPLLPGVLRDAGYYTGLLGKWHSEGPMPFERGCFDETLCSPQSSPVISYQQPRLSRNGTVEQFYVYTTDLFAGEAEDFIERNKSKPFALTIAFNAPHIDHVVMPAGIIRSNYDAAVAAGEIYDVPKAPTARPGEAEAYSGQFPGDTARADTAATIVALDGAVGRILDKLQQAGLDQKTIIFFFADNGGHPENRSENGVLRDYKWSHFEGGIRVPFLVAYPGVFPAGLQYSNPVSTLDIFPTVTALAGANPPTNLDGVDLTPYLRSEKTTSPHDALYFNTMQHWAIRQEQWKLVFEEGKLQLFNLATDLEEKYDLAAAEPVLVNELQQKWQTWNDQIPAVNDGAISKAGNTDDLNLSSSWVGGVVPGTTNVALWDNILTGANSAKLGSDLSWQGLAVANPGGAVTIQAGNTLTLGSSGIDMTNATQDLTLNCGLNLTTNVSWVVAAGRQLLVNSPVGGTGGFTLSGGGFAALNAPNTFTGAVTVANGTLLLAGAGNQSATTIQNGAVLRVADSASFGGGGLTIPVAGGATGRLELSNNITVLSGQTLSMNGRNSSSDGIRNVSGSNTIAGTFSFGPGGANYWVQSDAGLLTLAGTVTAASTGSRTLTLQGTADGLISGRIQNGNATMNLIKAGAGTWTLSATNTFTGSTTVNGGTLVVNGVINSPSTVIVEAGGTLSGRGTLCGPVTIHAGGRLAPGAGGIAALTISNSLTLAPASTIVFELNKGAHTNDSIRGLSSVSYDGSLVVTNLGEALTVGDSFTLFRAAAYSGSFAQLVLPALDPELGWSNRLALDGSVLVVRTAPFKLAGAGSAGGGSFSFDVNGPANQTYAIQATTNLSITSSWVTLGWTNPVALPFRFSDPQANQFAQRFYRAVLGLPASTNPPPVGPDDPAAPPEPRVPLVLTYTLIDPDNGTNVGVWSTSGYTEDATWRSASSFSAIQDAMNQGGTKQAWVRFKATSTDLTYNSTFFASKHTGLITVWSEGVKNTWNKQGDGTNWLRYFGTIYRNDVVGTPTQYGVEYTDDSSVPASIDFAFVQMQMQQVAELRNAGSDSTNFHQVLDIPMIRDACAIKGPDNYYYMVGTPDMHGKAEGILLFRSDSRSGPFTNMGLVWTFTNSIWANLSKMNPTNDIVIWAPEIAFIKGKWYLVYFPSVAPEGYARFQIGIAASDNPLGPYVDTTNAPIVEGTDPHLFEDDDGSVYLTYSTGNIAKMNSAMNGFADTPRHIYPHNSQSVAKEGTTLFKCNGYYYFSGALRIRTKYPDGTVDNTYDNVMCISTNGIYGPYGDRFVAIKNGGNNSFFQDADGTWHCTIWQPDQKATIVAVELAPDGTWRPAENYDVLPNGTFY